MKHAVALDAISSKGDYIFDAVLTFRVGAKGQWCVRGLVSLRLIELFTVRAYGVPAEAASLRTLPTIAYLTLHQIYNPRSNIPNTAVAGNSGYVLVVSSFGQPPTFQRPTDDYPPYAPALSPLRVVLLAANL